MLKSSELKKLDRFLRGKQIAYIIYLQLQTFAMYKQELNRDQVTPSDQRLRTVVRQHVDPGPATSKARNERIETGVMVKSQKGRTVSAERKMGECFRWRATGQCSKRRFL